MEYTKSALIKEFLQLFHSCPGNRITAEAALPGCEGMLCFEEPMFRFASAGDPLFSEFKKPYVIGPAFMAPQEWLPDAKTVISFFLPITERVRTANRGGAETAPEWLHARIEGQNFINRYTGVLQEWLEGRGIHTVVPSSDSRFHTVVEDTKDADLHIESAWSERHAAFVSGLGTFSLSRGLITEKGIAGRFGSIIVSEEIEPDMRPYTGIEEYCIQCGACIRNCPPKAISFEKGKNHLLCRNYLNTMGKKYAPRYGCGKCQVNVPCEFRNPARPACAANEVS